MMKELLDELVRGVIGGPDDLTGMERCLDLLDRLEGCPGYSQRWAHSVHELRRLFKAVLAGDSEDPDGDWETMRKLIAAFCANGSHAGAPEASAESMVGQEPVEENDEAGSDVSGGLHERFGDSDREVSVPIQSQELNILVDMIAQLALVQSVVLKNPQVLAIKDATFHRSKARLGRITAELQRMVMKARMAPIKNIFQEMAHLARHCAVQSGKQVSLLMRGEETEIEQDMVEAIHECLGRMIRNAVDHGIETPEERVGRKKAPAGTIFLAAERKGGNVVIDIEVDGRGLDAGRVPAREIERRVIPAEEQTDGKSILELKPHPGFHGNERVTDAPGRCADMFVVRSNVEALGGKLIISGHHDAGARFRLVLPLSRAMIDGMVVGIGEERYVVPTIAVRESLRPSRMACVKGPEGSEMIKVRDSLLPLIRLHRTFGVSPHYVHPWEGMLVIVVEDGDSYCLLVDEIAGRQEVFSRKLDGALRDIRGIAGWAVLGDGRDALVIDVSGVVSIHAGGSSKQ